MPLPPLLIVSEAAVAPEAQGASTTLYELFGSYPGPLRIISSSRGPDDHLDRVRVPRRILPERLNHLGVAATRIRGRADGWLLRHGPWLRGAVRDFRPRVILACPLTGWGVAAAAGASQIAEARLISYFMDDWVGTARAAGVVGLLRRSSAWLTISEQLRDDFVERYALEAPPAMVVHNPARASSEPRRDRAATGSRRPCRIVYAGSIWPMHADAIQLTADAVGLLRARGEQFEFVVHTSPSFASRHSALFEKDGVIAGGLCDPAELRQRLLDADLALVACSFDEEQRLMSRSSVQTKLTAYMSAGVPIIAVGPEGAASIEFVEHWAAGRCCTRADVAYLAETIRAFAESDDLSEISARSRAVVRKHFDTDEVRARLWRFVAAVSGDSRPSPQTA